MSLSAVDLAAELIRFDTINPPGQEAACTDHLARLLTEADFQCETVPLDEGRPNLIARIGGTGDKPPIAFTGHTDTVPVGAQAWTVAPHGGIVGNDRLWGRGASDMKSGVAAFVVAALEHAARLEGTPGVVLTSPPGRSREARVRSHWRAAGCGVKPARWWWPSQRRIGHCADTRARCG
jgi:succinyl-diaminopimelate desuccinylase